LVKNRVSDEPKIGDEAPDFELTTAEGGTVRLSSFRGEKNVVVYFYQKDFSPGCTKEACSFRDNYERFRELNTEVLGVSTDDAASHSEFAEEYELPFPLLIDEEQRVSDMYGARRLFGLLPKRVTFVIDKSGVVRNVYSSETRPRSHIEEALETVGEIKEDSANLKA
jgi:peroxiredoxin Q/BCP